MHRDLYGMNYETLHSAEYWAVKTKPGGKKKKITLLLHQLVAKHKNPRVFIMMSECVFWTKYHCIIKQWSSKKAITTTSLRQQAQREIFREINIPAQCLAAATDQSRLW